MLLQSGDPETLHLWRIFVAESMRHADEVYDLLGVLLTDDDIVGESFYNPLLPVVVAELDAKGLLVEDDGALCVFPEGFENRHGEPLPLIVRKSDGGYGYPATDLAAVRDRTGRLGATRLVYVVGAEQSLHLRLVFAVAALAGYLPEASTPPSTSRSASSSGTDGKKLASRSRRLGAARRPAGRGDRPGRRRHEGALERPVARAPGRRARTRSGIGAVKYADLSTERMRDYVFDWDRMLAFEGDTGPYLQYAHARIRSIFRRAGVAPPAPGAVPAARRAPGACAGAAAAGLRGGGRGDGGDLQPVEAVHLPLRAGHHVHRRSTRPAGCWSTTRRCATSRLGLCDLTARVLELGLSLLGIEAPEQM